MNAVRTILAGCIFPLLFVLSLPGNVIRAASRRVPTSGKAYVRIVLGTALVAGAVGSIWMSTNSLNPLEVANVIAATDTIPIAIRSSDANLRVQGLYILSQPGVPIPTLQLTFYTKVPDAIVEVTTGHQMSCFEAGNELQSLGWQTHGSDSYVVSSDVGSLQVYAGVRRTSTWRIASRAQPFLLCAGLPFPSSSGSANRAISFSRIPDALLPPQGTLSDLPICVGLLSRFAISDVVIAGGSDAPDTAEAAFSDNLRCLTEHAPRVQTTWVDDLAGSWHEFLVVAYSAMLALGLAMLAEAFSGTRFGVSVWSGVTTVCLLLLWGVIQLPAFNGLAAMSASQWPISLAGSRALALNVYIADGNKARVFLLVDVGNLKKFEVHVHPDGARSARVIVRAADESGNCALANGRWETPRRQLASYYAYGSMRALWENEFDSYGNVDTVLSCPVALAPQELVNGKLQLNLDRLYGPSPPGTKLQDVVVVTRPRSAEVGDASGARAFVNGGGFIIGDLWRKEAAVDLTWETKASRIRALVIQVVMDSAIALAAVGFVQLLKAALVPE